MRRKDFWQLFFDKDALYFEHKQLLLSDLYLKEMLFLLKYCKSPVLEVGCGDGVFLEFLLKNGVFCCGIDFNKKRVERARERLRKFSFYFKNVVYFADFTDMFKGFENMFNTIVFKESLEHIPDYFMALINAYQCLTLKGRVLISFYDYSRGKKITPSLVHLFTGIGLKNVLKYIGFKNVKILGYLGNFTVVVAQKMTEKMNFDRMLKGKGSYFL